MRPVNFLFLPFLTASVMSQGQPIGSASFHWAELPIEKNGSVELRKIVKGHTAEFEYFEIIAISQMNRDLAETNSSLNEYEELIIIKEGTVRADMGNKSVVLSRGSVILVPPFESLLLKKIGEEPLSWYSLKFSSGKKMNLDRSAAAGGSLLLNHDSLPYTEKNNRGTRKYFDRPTAMCENYEMHVTYLKEKGASHKPHQHVDTEIILVIDGNTEMTIDGLTYNAGPGDLYIVETGKLHGISNASDKPCSYFAFKWR